MSDKLSACLSGRLFYLAAILVSIDCPLVANEGGSIKQQTEGRQSEESVHQTTSAAADALAAPRRGPAQRGEGKNREMLLRGRVLSVDGYPARDFHLTAKAYKSHLGRDVLPTTVEGNEFEVWVPVGRSHWFYVELTAEASDGKSRVFRGIENRELRKPAVDGVELQLAPTSRAVEVSVKHDNLPVANAHVRAELEGHALLVGKTGSNGRTVFRLGEGEKLSQLTAWTDDFRIGGYSFSRKPHRDPFGAEFTIELDDCRDQTVRFLDTNDNSPVANVPFDLIIGTGQPNYNFAAVPATFPHCRMTTDTNGEATLRWFPNWETHAAYVEIVDSRWTTAVDNSDFTIADDGALVMTLKRRVSRKPFSGRVTSDHYHVGGLLVEIKSFQGEQQGRSDFVYAFTDTDGGFTADCIPGAVYTVCVNDGKLASKMIDLIPYELDKGKSNFADLEVTEGQPVEIRVTSGPSRKPVQNQRVYVRQNHEYTWMEDGKRRSGVGARDFPVYTDEDGVGHAWALAGSKLRITVYAGEWRSADQNVTVKEDGITVVEIHRAIDDEREAKGRLLAPPNVDVELAGAQIVYGSIDGETHERETITADVEGRFAFRTKAIQLGIFAYTADGKAAGIAKPESIDSPIELQLRPTMDLHGQLLGKQDKPLAYHAVRVKPRVSGKRDFSKSFPTSFEAKTFDATTDSDGNYTLKNLPAEFDMTLRADPIDGSKYDAYLDDFYLVAGDDRPRMVSRLDRTREPDDRTLAQKYRSVLRDAKLGDYYVIVLSYDAMSKDFVDTKLLDHDTTREVMSFLNLRVDESSLASDADRVFATSKRWRTTKEGTVLACALDANGNELARIEVDSHDASATPKAAEFIRRNAPPQADAKAKWRAAFAEAKRSGRHVWARIGQRYCGPCFRLSRWLDDNREQLERDYVLLKIDDVRDKHGAEIANRIVSNRDHFGIPFHAIFDVRENLLIDSEGPTGNIGHPSSFEGRRHLRRMLIETKTSLTDFEIDEIVSTLGK